MGRPLRTLIVDPSPVFASGAGAFFVDRPALDVVGTARTGAEALREAGSIRPDLVLLEAVLPEIDGFRLTRALKALPSPPLVVMVTFFASEAARENAFAAGADGFLAKDEIGEGFDLLLEEFATRRAERSAEVKPPGRPARPGSRTVPDP